jgi:hypothetical protein
VIDEVRDRDALRERAQPADVVLMIVRADQVVDPRHPRGREHRHDAVAVARAGIPGVDQHGLSRRRDVERRLSALGVGDVDVERARRRGARDAAP